MRWIVLAALLLPGCASLLGPDATRDPAGTAECGRSIGELSIALALQPSPRAHEARGQCYLKLARWREARADFDVVVLAWAGLTRPLLERAASETALGDDAAAERDLDQVLRFEPDNVEGYAALAGLYEMRGDAANAALMYGEALRRAPSAKLHLGRASAYLAQCRYDDARADAQAALKAAPRDPAALDVLGVAALREHRWRLAEQAFGLTLREQPHNRVALLDRAEAELAQGRLPAAQADLDALSAVTLRYPPATLARGELDLRRSAWDGALAEFDAALHEAAASPLLPNERVFVVHVDGACAERSPDVKEEWSAQAQAGRARALHALARDAEALSAADAALALRPARAPLHDLRGESLAALRRGEDARAEFEKALALAPGDAGARAGLAALPGR